MKFASGPECRWFWDAKKTVKPKKKKDTQLRSLVQWIHFNSIEFSIPKKNINKKEGGANMKPPSLSFWCYCCDRRFDDAATGCCYWINFFQEIFFSFFRILKCNEIEPIMKNIILIRYRPSQYRWERRDWFFYDFWLIFFFFEDLSLCDFFLEIYTLNNVMMLITFIRWTNGDLIPSEHFVSSIGTDMSHLLKT